MSARRMPSHDGRSATSLCTSVAASAIRPTPISGGDVTEEEVAVVGEKCQSRVRCGQCAGGVAPHERFFGHVAAVVGLGHPGQAGQLGQRIVVVVDPHVGQHALPRVRRAESPSTTMRAADICPRASPPMPSAATSAASMRVANEPGRRLERSRHGLADAVAGHHVGLGRVAVARGMARHGRCRRSR